MRQVAEDMLPQWIDDVDDPAIVLAPVDPGKDEPARTDGVDDRSEASPGILQVVEHADRVGDVEAAGTKWQPVEIGLDESRRPQPRGGRVDRLRQIDPDGLSRTPLPAVLDEPAETAAYVEDPLPGQVPGRERNDPVSPLLLGVRVVPRIVRPGVAEGLGRPGLLLGLVRGVEQTRNASDDGVRVPLLAVEAARGLGE